jgi:hypothetical protein
MLLASLLALNGILAAALYLYLAPQQVVEEKRLKTLRGEVSTLRADIDRMQLEFMQLEAQKQEFGMLEKDGFFKNQSRRQAENTFSAIQKRSGVGSAIASISAGVIEDNEEALKAKYKILKSPIQVQIEAVSDVDIYHYLFLIENYFPGHVSVENVKIKRESDVSGTVLRAIAAGSNPPLVKAELDMIWRTMIPEAEVIGADEAQPQGVLQ